MSPSIEYLTSATYCAPFGTRRMYDLAKTLSLRYLYATDLLIGVIGADGSGKSTLIKGLFPGLELTNDDEGVNTRNTPLFEFSEEDFFSAHTFHIDVRFESAFRQKYEICEAVNRAIEARRRVVIEHFDLIYQKLGYNAQVLFAIDDQVRVYRPTVFGPSPIEIMKEAKKNARYRLMAHSAEDLTIEVLNRDYGFKGPEFHSNVRHGFVIGFRKKPHFSIAELEAKVIELIRKDLKIVPLDGHSIEIGEQKLSCTGKRIHVSSTRKIENFRLMKRFRYDPITREYLLVGLVGKEQVWGLRSLPPVHEPEVPE